MRAVSGLLPRRQAAGRALSARHGGHSSITTTQRYLHAMRARGVPAGRATGGRTRHTSHVRATGHRVGGARWKRARRRARARVRPAGRPAARGSSCPAGAVVRDVRDDSSVVVVVYILALAVVLFLFSGVLPRYRECVGRLPRVIEFERRYREYADADRNAHADRDIVYTAVTPEQEAAGRRAEELRPWLVARRNEMQRDAQSVGKGVMYVAPPPMIGGSYKPHSYFLDLFDEQTDSIGSSRVRLDDLVTIIHEVEWQRDLRRRDLYNPAAWTRLTFLRLVRSPAHALRAAGFSKDAAATTVVKVFGAIWSGLVGAAGIAGLVWAVTHTN